MNERIKELSDKCGLAWTLKTEQDVKNLVEFAELIIRECLDIVQKQQIFDTGYNRAEAMTHDAVLVGHDDCAIDTVHKLKEHFGVE